MWEIVTYGGGEFLALLLNGVAALTRTNDYLGLLRVMAMVALVWLLVEAAFSDRRPNYQWLLAMAMIYLCLIVPRTDVLVRDRINPANNAVVANVPLGLAMFAGFSSRIGDWLTRGFETTFALPDDINYQNSGALFTHHLLRASTRFRITDARLAENLSQFWRQCAFYDILLGLYTLDDLRDSDDIRTFLADHTSVSRRFTYTTEPGERELLICRVGFNNQLGNDLDNEIDRARSYFGRKLVNANTDAEAIARFSTALPLSYQFITGITRNAEQIITQQSLANSADQGLIDFTVASNAAAAAHSFTLAKAQRERRLTFHSLGELASRTLPLLRGLLEGVIIGLFPIIGMLLVLPFASKVLLNYGKAMLWVQLWAPLYALLNLAVMLYSRSPGQSAMRMPDGNIALTLANHTALSDAMAETAAMAGYLSMSIPLISYLILHGAGAVAASVASGLVQSYEGPVSRAAEEVATGNVALANTSVGNASWWQQNTAPSHSEGFTRQTGESAVTHIQGGTGASITQVPLTSTPLRIDTRNAISEEYGRRGAEEWKAAREEAASFESKGEASLATVSSVSQALRQDESLRSGLGSDQAERLNNDVATVEKTLDTLTQQHGFEQSEALSVIAGGGFRINSVLSAGATTENQAGTRDSTAYQEADQYVRESGVRESLDRVVQFAQSEQYASTLSATENDAVQKSASVAELTAHAERTQASLGRHDNYQQWQAQTEQGTIGHGEDLSGRLYSRLVAEQGQARADHLLQVHHGNVPGASQAERNEAASVIRQHVSSLASELVESHIGQGPTADGVVEQGNAGLQEQRARADEYTVESKQQPDQWIEQTDNLQQGKERIQQHREEAIPADREGKTKTEIKHAAEDLKAQQADVSTDSKLGRVFGTILD